MVGRDAKKVASIESLAVDQPEQAKRCVTLDKVIVAILLVLLWSLFIVPFILFYSFTTKVSPVQCLAVSMPTEVKEVKQK